MGIKQTVAMVTMFFKCVRAFTRQAQKMCQGLSLVNRHGYLVTMVTWPVEILSTREESKNVTCKLPWLPVGLPSLFVGVKSEEFEESTSKTIKT